jgi:uncharacterized repeat protein (TIGR03803 family)
MRKNMRKNLLLTLRSISISDPTAKLQDRTIGRGRTMNVGALAALGVLLLAVLVATALPAQAQTLTVLYNFSDHTDGGFPQDGLVMDAQGNLFGTAAGGGNLAVCTGSGCGVVFKITPSGQETVVHTFSGGVNGGIPQAGVILDAKGDIYGMTPFLGAHNNGMIFKIFPGGNYRVLYAFAGGTDGVEPQGGLLRDGRGNLYGTTADGGSFNGGTVFELSPTGTKTVLYNFAFSPDGANPTGDLIRDAQGNLYGTTTFGGITGGICASLGCGTVFKLNPNGTETVLHTFAAGVDGAFPETGLVRDAMGNLYGTTQRGGASTTASNMGTVFKVTPAGVETVLYIFNGGTADGEFPFGRLILDAAGNLYGTTSAGDGFFPLGGLVRDATGNLYGTTERGGSFNAGVVFKITP